MKIDALKFIYFSATGTTKAIIEAVARGIGHKAAETIDITKSQLSRSCKRGREPELFL